MRDGERISTRYSPGYFKMLRDFARYGSLKKQYGNARILRWPHNPKS